MDDFLSCLLQTALYFSFDYVNTLYGNKWEIKMGIRPNEETQTTKQRTHN